MIIDQIKTIMKNEELEDVLVIGYIDDDEDVDRFVPLLNYVYLIFESKIIRILRKQSTNFQI